MHYSRIRKGNTGLLGWEAASPKLDRFNRTKGLSHEMSA